MRITALIITFLLLCCSGYSQNSQNVFYHKNDKIYQLMELDSPPIFVGGYDSLLAHIDRHFVFPSIYSDASIQGRIICKFTVTENGSIIDVKVLQGIDAELDDEAIRVIYSMPRWCPGKKNGQAVKVEYFLSIYCRTK